MDLIGIVPAGGEASRLGQLPCSKEILPVGLEDDLIHKTRRLKPVCSFLLHKMKQGGAENVYIILRRGKWDIPGLLGTGKDYQLNLAYLLLEYPFGVPFTVDAAFPFVKDAQVLFGFPDIVVTCDDLFTRLLDRLNRQKEDLVLALFAIQPGQKADMVQTNGDGQVLEIQIKPENTRLEHAWIAAAWTPEFTQFLHDWVAEKLDRINYQNVPGEELWMSSLVQNAMDSDLKVGSVIFQGEQFLDIGTPEGLEKAFLINHGN